MNLRPPLDTNFPALHCTQSALMGELFCSLVNAGHFSLRCSRSARRSLVHSCCHFWSPTLRICLVSLNAISNRYLNQKCALQLSRLESKSSACQAIISSFFSHVNGVGVVIFGCCCCYCCCCRSTCSDMSSSTVRFSRHRETARTGHATMPTPWRM